MNTPPMLFFQLSCLFNPLALFFCFSLILITKFLISNYRKSKPKSIHDPSEDEEFELFSDECSEKEDVEFFSDDEQCLEAEESEFFSDECSEKDEEIEFFTDECREKDEEIEFFSDECREKDEEIEFFSDECREKDEEIEFFSDECSEKDDLVAEILRGGEALLFLPSKTFQSLPGGEVQVPEGHDVESKEEKGKDREKLEEAVEMIIEAAEQVSMSSFNGSEDGDQDSDWSSSILQIGNDDPICTPKDSPNDERRPIDGRSDVKELEFPDSLLTQESTNMTGSWPDKKLPHSFSGHGSTSKSSCEWRSSTNYRESELEDVYSSSSRRSSTGWDFDSTFRKYDEEMVFFDRISAQKLYETGDEKSSSNGKNPYRDLETAYVAQICLAWEALDWNYKNFRQWKIRNGEEYSGCSAQIAQQFQQFQVLLQRFIENEPYEHGRRPEIYARMRICAPKLLRVPEFKDLEGDDPSTKNTDPTTISSLKFLQIIENAIRTFMDFLESDKENKSCRIMRLLRPNHRNSVDPTRLRAIKKVVVKKKKKLKDLQRSHKCFVAKRRLKKGEGMEISMALTDLKVVSRVLRMSEISEEQLRWCEEKVSKVRVLDGKMQRDPSAFFFPTH